MTTFVRQADGSYRRDDEVHRNVLVDVSSVPATLHEHGITATVGRSFDDHDHPLPVGLLSVTGRRR